MDHRGTLERLRSLDVTTEEERRRAYDEISAAVRAAPRGDVGRAGAEPDRGRSRRGARARPRGRVPRESVTALLAACDAARYGPPQALPSAQACRDALATRGAGARRPVDRRCGSCIRNTRWWLLAAFAAVALLKWGVRWRFAAFTAVLPSRRFPYRASLFRRLPFAVLAVAAALAGARASCSRSSRIRRPTCQSKGLDIVLLLDLSSSMQEEMGSGQTLKTTTVAGGRTRMDAVKDAVKTFIRTRRDDRIGLVVFSDNPYVISPLTFDHEYLLHYIDFVDDKLLQGEGQTAIGDGLALSDYVLSRQATPTSRGHQVVVLFTDGESNRGREPVDVLKEAKEAGIRVHVVGVDLEADVKEKPGVQMLMAAVEDAGGRYFSADSERDLIAASRTIDSMEKGLLVSRVYVRDVPVYQWFAIPALVTLVARARSALDSVLRRSDVARRKGGNYRTRLSDPVASAFRRKWSRAASRGSPRSGSEAPRFRREGDERDVANLRIGLHLRPHRRFVPQPRHDQGSGAASPSP